MYMLLATRGPARAPRAGAASGGNASLSRRPTRAAGLQCPITDIGGEVQLVELEQGTCGQQVPLARAQVLRVELEVGLSESLLPLLEFDAALEVPESPLRAYWRF